MSAIFGVWHKNGEPVDEKHLQKMQSEVSQYGRDAQDVYLDHNIGFGCCLNKWSKYSREEVPVHQDARSEIFLVCDALIYNRDELIEKYCLTDNIGISTQELLLAAYKKWGEGCAKYINGDEREWVESVCRQEGLESRYLDRTKALEQGTKKGLPTVGNDEIYRRELELMSAHNVRFVLTGWGGDEGISHRANLNELFLRGYWGYFFKEIRQLAKGSPLRFAKLIFANTIMPLFSTYAIFGNPNKGRPVIINKKFLEKMKKDCKRDTFTFKVNPQKHIQSGGIQTRTELLAWVNADYNTQHLRPYLSLLFL